MTRILKYKALLISAALFAMLGMLRPGALYGTVNPCAEGGLEPAFLATGVTPNVLLLIDNSASMYDLAYIGGQGTCFDDSFDSSLEYAGYFDAGTWYFYDTTDGQFEEITGDVSSHSTWTGAAGDSYINANAVYLKRNATPAITVFFAKGNFLNWATASKLDIEKKILTGGKYETTGTYGAPDDRLVLESRGCVDRRFIKKVEVLNGVTIHYLTMGVRPPREAIFDAWKSNTSYAPGSIVNYLGDLYFTAAGGTSSATGFGQAPGITDWALYTLTRWTNGTAYPANSIVSNEGTMYITAAGGTASGTGVANDTGITDWETYNVTHIEIFDPITSFDNSDCELAILELAKESPNQGQLKAYIEGCMGYSPAGAPDAESNLMAAFNHSIHNCWYEAKHGSWPDGTGYLQSIKPACEAAYDEGIEPWEITTDDRGYVCYGCYNDDPAKRYGYVGRCWVPGEGAVWECIKYHPQQPDECLKYGWVGGAEGHWLSDECIELALQEYCGLMEIPEVIDPSDQASETSTFWNLPAVLFDSGVVAQIGKPLTVLKGYIKQSSTPTGLIQEFSSDFRMGAMVFNEAGSHSECAQIDPTGVYNCLDASNKDGAKVISYIDQSDDAHTTELVNAINNIKAASWTPVAEAMYNAIGYFTQNTSLRLDGNDFKTAIEDPTNCPDPITFWCQSNKILLITDGASTADLCGTVKDFVAIAGHNDGDTDDPTGCGTLAGSTFFDDLAYYAKHGTGIYPVEPFDGGSKQNITTHIVVAGTPRTEGTGECSPEQLLSDAATHGGTTLYTAEDPSQLETTLRNVFTVIRAGVASSSSATVISSSRSGEGAMYQAIFWTNIPSTTPEVPVVWTGEVHTLLIDSYGDMYEDTNTNRTLDSGDEKVIFYYDSDAGMTKACYGVANPDGTCTGTSKGLAEVKYLWSAAEWLADISPADIILNRTSVSSPVQTEYISNTKKRYIFTWNDLDNDGIVDTSETLPFVPTFAVNTAPDPDELTLGGTALSLSGGRGPVTLDFGHAGQITADAATDINNLAKWIRGLDQAGQRTREVPTPSNFVISGSPATITWRLGDIVHSTPMLVAGPAEAYDLIYWDSSYLDFVRHYWDRRSVLYFGGNDGMLHALNAGFYNSAQHKFCLAKDCTPESEALAPGLGAELWAYVPYNLLPHLQCLTDISYGNSNELRHKYYVDLRPRIFDVRIWPIDPDDGIHINGWGTILVGGMKFGGAPITAHDLDLNDVTEDYPSDTRKFISAYFIIDITDPENPPTLLAEMTSTGVEADLGYTTVISTAVPMKTDDSTSAWYLILGSGPTELDGTSTQNAKIAVLPLDWLVDNWPLGTSRKPFRIPNGVPTSLSDQGGVFTLSADANSFISDPITVDFNVGYEQNYKADAVYFGTVAGYWGDWSGKLYRLVTHKEDYEGNETTSLPSEWSALVSPDNPCPLIDVQQPVTASPTVGVDGSGNYWVYFGTGRYLNPEDKTDTSSNAQQTFYGIKEPQVKDAENKNVFTWATVQKTDSPTASIVPGERGLVRVDQIQVCGGSECGTVGGLSCKDGTDCLPQIDSVPISHFSELIIHIGGIDGWYKDFSLPRERNLGQATLLGGLLTFTTYQPYDDVCMSEGLGFLYGVDYLTGTASDKAVFTGGGGYGNSATGLIEGKVADKMNLGRGLVLSPSLHIGSQEGPDGETHKVTTAIIQTSTGNIVKIKQEPGSEGAPENSRISWRDLTW